MIGIGLKSSVKVAAWFLWVTIITGAMIYNAWQHDWLLLFWLGLLIYHLVTAWIEYGNVNITNNFIVNDNRTPKQTNKRDGI